MLRINWPRFRLEDCRIKLHPENLPLEKRSYSLVTINMLKAIRNNNMRKRKRKNIYLLTKAKRMRSKTGLPQESYHRVI